MLLNYDIFICTWKSCAVGGAIMGYLCYDILILCLNKGPFLQKYQSSLQVLILKTCF